MLSKEKNMRLTQVGPGTPGGNFLRCYWHPIAAADELLREATKPVRLLGEDLVLYRDRSGGYGLLERHCAHRSADLSYGFVEDGGLRCNYHGWLFDARGDCIEQPYEDTVNPAQSMRKHGSLVAYPVQEKGGLLWAYLGALPAPELPDWEAFSWPNGFVQIVFADVPCNWVQAQENSIDPVHFEWMHSNWSRRMKGASENTAPRHLKLQFDEFEHGFVYRRVREDTSEQHPLWSVGRVCLWPNAFYLGDHFEWRVPVDDENTLSITWSYIRVPQESEPFVQTEIPSWVSPIKDPVTGRWIASHVINQDIIAWVGQGTITDRSREKLGASDRGISLMRKRLFDDIDKVENGESPSGLIRDPARNRRLPLPTIDQMLIEEGLPLSKYESHPLWKHHLKHFPFHYGQPEHVKQAYEEAMGLKTVAVDVVNI